LWVGGRAVFVDDGPQLAGVAEVAVELQGEVGEDVRPVGCDGLRVQVDFVDPILGDLVDTRGVQL